MKSNVWFILLFDKHIRHFNRYATAGDY